MNHQDNDDSYRKDIETFLVLLELHFRVIELLLLGSQLILMINQG